MKLNGEQVLLRVHLRNKLQQLLPFLDEGMITIEAVKVLRYRHHPAKVRSSFGH